MDNPSTKSEATIIEVNTKLVFEKFPNIYKQIEKPALPLFITNWLFGIGIIECPMGKPRRLLSFIYSTTILLVYFMIAGYTYPYLKNLNFETMKNIIKILFFSNCFLTITTTALGWYRSKEIHRILHHIAMADHLLENIGILKNYAKIFRLQLGKIVGFALFLMIIITLNILLSTHFAKSGRIIIGLIMNYPIIIMFIVDATFINIIEYIRLKLIKLNKVLKKMTSSTSDCPQRTRVTEKYTKKWISFVNCKNSVLNSTYVIRIAKKAHSEFVKTCKVADDAFGLHILMSMIAAITVITGSLYHLYSVVLYTKISWKNFSTVLLNTITWLVYYFIKIYMLSYCCSAVSEESIRTGDVISEIYDEPFVDEDTRNEIRDFHIQLIQNSLKFQACGFVTLDFTLIQGIIASITTYLMVLIQLGNSANT